MKQIALWALAVAASVAPSFAADPDLLNMAMPDAQMFAGINVEQAKTTQFGQFLLSKMHVSSDFQKFVDSTGFDPRRDVREVLVVTAGLGPLPDGTAKAVTSSSALFLAKGSFNIPQILAAAKSDAKVKVTDYAGAKLLTVGDGQETQALGVIDASTVVAGDSVSVRAALDRRMHANAISPDLAAQINQLSTTEDAWSISNADFSAFVPLGGTDQSGSAVLKGVRQASGGVKFGSMVKVDGQAVTREPSDATALSDVIRFVAQMLQMRSSATDAAAAQVRDLLKGLTVTTEGNVVKVSIEIPEDQIELLLNMADEHTGALKKI